MAILLCHFISFLFQDTLKAASLLDFRAIIKILLLLGLKVILIIKIRILISIIIESLKDLLKESSKMCIQMMYNSVTEDVIESIIE